MGPCNIGKVFEIGDGCTLDFGTRAVTILATGKIDILSNTVSIRAGSFTIAPQGSVEGRGTLNTPPRDRGGLLTITTTGAVNLQKATFKGVIDVSGNARGGTVNIVAGGSITVSGDVIANNLTTSGTGGIISLRSGGDITSGTASTISAAGGYFTTGGFIEIGATGKVDLGTNLVADGGDGGVIDVAAGGEAIVRGLSATANGDAGSGGCAGVFAGTRVQMLGSVVLNGTGSATQSGGGCGGFIDIEARFGDTTISSFIKSESGAPDGGGGGISVVAGGSIVTTTGALLSAQGQGEFSCGGEISLESDLDITASGDLDASGGFGGNLVDVIAGRNVTLNGMADVRGRDGGGFGGAVTIVAGGGGQGNVAINNVIDVGGGLCSPINGCGLGGFTDIAGCDVTVAAAGALLADGADGGDNLLVAREKLTVQGRVDATTTSGMTNGMNFLQYPSRVAPTIVAPNITPPPVSQAFATCTLAGEANCLVPCPVCGNGLVEFPETCDQSGNTTNCDGCSNFCRVQNCNDSNVCTTDSCDATLGCRNAAVADGPSCTDNNVCNGVEQCTAGLCRSPTPPLNCNDSNQCTTDACHPTLGCQNSASPANTPCNDGNASTCNDRCDGARVCVGQTSCSTTTTLPIPTTTSTTVRPPTTTSTSAPIPTTTSTSSPIPTTTSTSSPIPTTTSTSSPIPTTTSTSVPGATTTSTTAPLPTTTSTSVPCATTTSTTAPTPATTSTSTPVPNTTSTTLPTGCVPANCSDGNACTADVCQAGTCVHRRDGFEAVSCEVGKLTTASTSLCAPDPVDAKLANAFTIKGTKARTFVDKAKNNTKTGQKLLNRALKQLTGLRNKVGKVFLRGKITENCRTRLDALLVERQTLVQGLSTP